MTDKPPMAPTTPAAPAGTTPTVQDTGMTPPRPRETGGPKGPDPVRYGDWERNGKCVDF
ncbi:DUF1674 domain-containing protein [Tistrella bauzanensis]|nr:succinate dehydrogenase assembly factor 4 [Tistrella bauzanensis]